MPGPLECSEEDAFAAMTREELDAALREAHAQNADDPEADEELKATAERGHTDPD